MRQFFVFFGIFLVSLVSFSNTALNPKTMQAGLFHEQQVYERSKHSSSTLDKDASVLSFVGDVMLARRVETYLDEYGSDYVYSQLPKIATSSTILFGNFEAAVHSNHTHTPDNTFSFSVDSIHLEALRRHGFTHMSLANNHSQDGEKTSRIITEESLEENELLWLGNKETLASSSIKLVTISDLTIGVLALNSVNVGLPYEQIKTTFKQMSDVSDVQVVYIHWGTEYSLLHSSDQQKTAYLLADLGADIIVGHHPHVVQDIEQYENTLIFYSLGNFIFDQYFSKDVQEGLLLEIKKDSSEQAVVKLQGITSIGSNSVPRYMSDYENEVFLQDVASRSSKPLKTQIQRGYIEFSID
jgi:poly-gamma-glutamate synthesis protein (capsule biosynthesis protein)